MQSRIAALLVPVALACSASCGGGGGGGPGSIAPTGLAYADPTPTYWVGFAIPTNQPLLAGGSVESYSVAAGALPVGLALAASSGEISGTPLFETPASGVEVTILATSSGGESSQTAVTIRVDRPRSRAAYVANTWDSSISAYLQDAGTGQLRHNGYAFTGFSTHPRSVAASPDGRRIYAATNPPLSASMVVVYAAHPVTGRIAEIQTLPNVGSGPIAMAVHPAGKFLYVLNYGSSSVAQFAIDAVTGALAPLAASASTGANPSGLALHPGGEFAYVSHLGADGTAPDPAPDAVWTMHIEADGSLDFVDTELAGADPTAIAVTRDGRFAYTTDRDADTLSTFAIDAATGTLARIGAGSVPAGGLGPYALAAAPGSDALYVANSLSATLSQFEVLSTGELVPLDPATVPTGAAPAALALDPSGEFLYAVSLSDNGVRNYRVLPDHTLVAEQPFEVRTRRSPGAIVVAPSPTSAAISSTALYVANTGFGDIAHFTLAPSTGLLTAKIPAQVLGGLGATWIDVHPELPAVYVAHATGATKLGVGPADQLMPPPTLSDPFAGNRSIHAESSGRFAFLVQPGASQAVRFAVDPITGALEDPIPAATGAQPGIAGLHPNGGFLYVPNQASASIAQFDISPASGQLSLKVPPLAATAAEPSAVLVDPTGRFAYVANRAVDQISLYVIDSFLGTLAPLADQPAIPTGASPVHMAMTPNGRFLYVACTGSTTSIPAQFPSVTRYIAFSDPEDMIADGSLFEPPSPSVTVGGTPHALATDAVGKFLYVSLEGGAVEVYPIEVDGSLGSLQQNIASGSGSRGLAPRQHVD